jgi:hypothetical protein
MNDDKLPRQQKQPLHSSVQLGSKWQHDDHNALSQNGTPVRNQSAFDDIKAHIHRVTEQGNT